MISSSTGVASGFTNDPQAATVAKDSTKTRSGTSASTPAVDGKNNQSTLTNSSTSAIFTASALLAAEAEDEHFTISAGNSITLQKSVASMVSFNSSSDEGPDTSRPNEALGSKVDVVYSLLSMLSSHDRLQSSQMLLSISQDRANCQLIRNSGCMSLLIQLLHPGDVVPLPPPVGDELEVIRRASEALKNIVRLDDDEARQRRDSFVLLLLEHVRNYVLHLRLVLATSAPFKTEFCEQAYAAMATLTKLSYDEEQRRSMCTLGGLHSIAEALILDQKIFSENCLPMNLDFRRFIGMTLTNLTYGASETKRLLCSSAQFLQALNAQISSQPEELRQVFAGVLRNLSWKTDAASKVALREAGTVTTLMRAAMEVQKEATLKSILSALWNLSAHCAENKAKICVIPSALEFLVSTLAYKSPSRSLAVVESGGGILRNVSSHVSLKEEYRAILRRHNCFQILLEHLQSPSLTIVSNACGTLWNLSAHSAVDQRTLLELGAEKKLRDLVHSKHKMISLGSSATLKNLLAGRAKDGGSTSSTDKNQYSLMKLRHMKPSMERANDQMIFMCQPHPIDCDQKMEMIPMATSSSPHRRQTPTMEIATMLSDVTRPVILKATTPPFRVPSIPSSKSTDPMSVSQLMNEATINPDLSRSQRMQSSVISTSLSLPNSKEEQIEMDKAAVHRFHNSLRRNSQPQTIATSVDDGQSTYSQSAYGNAAVQMQKPYALLHKPYAAYGEPAMASYVGNMAASGGIPMKTALMNPYVGSGSKSGSPEKQRSLENAHISQPPHYQQRPPFRKPSGQNTPAEFKSEPSSRGSKSVTALTPLMFSRQSSMESLDSCDQHSIRSTVNSEYSQLPTGLPSPSELPDSPTNTLPMPIRDKPQIYSQQQQNQQQHDINVEEKTSESEILANVLIGTNEPLLKVDSGAAAVSITGTAAIFPCYPDPTTCQPNATLGMQLPMGNVVGTDEDEKPKIYGKILDGDDDEKPRVFGKMSTDFETTRLSASSSLSALTIDSDSKVVPAKPAVHQTPPQMGQQFGFHSGIQNQQPFIAPVAQQQEQTKVQNPAAQEADNICQELQECILAGRPSPKTSDSFKTPRTAPQMTKTTPIKPAVKPCPAPPMQVAQTGEDEADLRDVMQSAMPKPKSVRPKPHNPNIRLASPHHKGKNVAIVRGTRLTNPPAQQPCGDSSHATNSCATAASSTMQQQNSLGKPADINIMEKSEELLECIAMAMPKPKSTVARKSKSLDRKSSQKRELTVAFTKNTEEKESNNFSSTSSAGILIPNSNDQDTRSLLLMSCSSALMNCTTTAERIKDAATLLDVSNTVGFRSPPVARVAPEPQCTNSTAAANAPAAIVSFQVAPPDSTQRDPSGNDGNEDSLSEDNYSQIMDDNFDIAPEDVDVDTMREEDWIFSTANEKLVESCGDMDLFKNTDMPSPTELLIECETFSVTTTDNADDSAAVNVGPRILKAPPPASANASQEKIIKGGRRVVQGNLATTLAAPKLVVRTTKATELRAKKTLDQQTNLRSRSMSPAMNSGVVTSTPRGSDCSIGKTSPSTKRIRHLSNSSGHNSPLTLHAPVGQKVENQFSKSPNSNRRQMAANVSVKPKRELGSNVRKKIESLQKRESASEEDATSPMMTRKSLNAGITNEKSRNSGSQKGMISKNSGDNSTKGKDGKKALVTTV